ncbi:MAG: hypothetical protein JWO82_3553 [Akkermansiaceae bacterium]|nr:hypothetical protein [Akkermansiaceae bacterium]
MKFDSLSSVLTPSEFMDVHEIRVTSIWIEMSAGNSRNVVAALQDFFGPMPEIREENFLSGDRMSQFGIEPMRIDILNSISGVEFSEAYPRQIEIDYSGPSIPFLSLIDLRANKLAAGRFKDLADLENLPQN